MIRSLCLIIGAVIFLWGCDDERDKQKAGSLHASHVSAWLEVRNCEDAAKVGAIPASYCEPLIKKRDELYQEWLAFIYTHPEAFKP